MPTTKPRTKGVAKRGKPRLGPPTTVRFPVDLAEWVRLEGVAHADGSAGVIRDAVQAARKAKEMEQDELRQHLLGALT